MRADCASFAVTFWDKTNQLGECMGMLCGNMVTQAQDFELGACRCETCEDDVLRCSYEKVTDSFVVGGASTGASTVRSERAVKGLSVFDVM